MGRLGLSIDPRALRPAADAVCIEFQELVSDRQVWGSEIEKVVVPDGSIGISDGSVWGVRLMYSSGTPPVTGH